MSHSCLLDAACAWSGVLRRKRVSDPDFACWLEGAAAQPVDEACIQRWHDELVAQQAGQKTDQTADQKADQKTAQPADPLRRTLRRLRQRVFYTLMVRDIHGTASFAEVVQATTHLAEWALAHSYRHVMAHLTALYGTPLDGQTGLPQEMLILGMGKLGGRELNVSSDIDLIMLYGNEGETTGETTNETTGARRPGRRISHHEFYTKLTQRMMPILSELDGDGQVFRTDLRLRPDGDSGALALGLPALEHYLITQGREWERYAWVKARPLPVEALAGSQPQAQWEELENLRRPFVYRKYFDFGALNALRNLRERIREDWQRRALARNGVHATHNIKLGDGGIREIEFIVQLNQLIRGGQQPSLQQRRLLKALHRQKTAGILPGDVADGLEQAYLFLRRLEHMLQYREDQQTHLLPSHAQQWAALAEAMGLSETTFRQTLDGHRQFVHQTFRNAFRLIGMGETDAAVQVGAVADAPGEGAPSLHALVRTHLGAAGEEIDSLCQRLDLLLDSPRMRRLSATARVRLQALLPAVIRAAGQTEHPAPTARHLLTLIEAISQRSAYLALLTEYPDTLARVARIVSASPWAAQYLHQYPLLLDSLIEWHSLMVPLQLDEVASELNIELDNCLLPDGAPDVEQQMNLLRDVQHQTVFQLLAQDLNGQLSVESLADALSALADICLHTIMARVWPMVCKTARDRTAPASAPPLLAPPCFAVIAYGKLGGKELGYASDLDLVFVYGEENDGRDGGQGALNAAQIYTQLARRMTSWLTTLTSSGRLYDVDLRLRPDGDAGLLAVPMTAFEQYQRQHAWPWEHQALTRARFVTGDAALGERFEALRREILLLPRDLPVLRGQVQAMREKIAAGHQNRTELFDLKHDPGGMVDIEFITQFLVLAHARHHPALLGNLGNIALLGLAAEAGLIEKDLAQRVADIYRHYRKTQHALRLQGASMARADPARFAQERVQVRELWQRVILA